MPKTAATALWPTAAAQTAASSRPRAVAARMMARGAPRTPAGTTLTIARPSATEPTMKLPRPSMAGSPAIGPTTGAGASGTAAGEVLSGFASRAVMGSLLHGCGVPRKRAYCIRTPGTGHMSSHFEPQPLGAGSATGCDDAVLVDFAVDRGPRHAQRLGRPDLVAVVVLQALHDRIPLDRLQRGQQPPAHRPAFGRQVLRHDHPGPAALDDLLEHLPELFGVARPVVPQQQLHRLRGAGQAALLAEPGQEEGHQLVQVLDVVAQRRQLHRALEEPQQPGQVGAGLLAVQGHRDPQLLVPAGRPGLLQRAGQR